jgi:hypothetical protein
MRVGVGVSVRILIATKDTQSLFHKKESRETNKYPQTAGIRNHAFILRMHDPYPMRMFRFSSTMTK